MTPDRPRRREIISALKAAERVLRWAGSLVILPGWVRFPLLQTANLLAEILDRDGQPEP